MYRKLICLAAILLIIITTISCGKTQQETLHSKLIGKWHSVKFDIEFMSDNTFLIKQRGKHGKFNILDDGRIKLMDMFGNLAFMKFQEGKLFMYEDFHLKGNDSKIYFEKIG